MTSSVTDRRFVRAFIQTVPPSGNSLLSHTERVRRHHGVSAAIPGRVVPRAGPSTVVFICYVEDMMNLSWFLVASLFAQCNEYQLPTLHRLLGPPALSTFAINHQTPSLPRWLILRHVNNPIRPSHSSWRLFIIADMEGGRDLTLPSLDLDCNETAFDCILEK